MNRQHHPFEILTNETIFVAMKLEEAAKPILDFFEESAFGEKTRVFLEALPEPQSKLSAGFPLMSPIVVLLLGIGYLSMIVFGTAIMKNRDRINLKYYCLVHNFLMSSMSLYIGLEVLRQAFLVSNYSLFGNGHDTNFETGISMARIQWVFYASKTLEFNDTLIMILKKNFRQISFLHVYHHLSILVVCWYHFYVVPNGDGYFSIVLNSFVHVIMYGYYLLSSLGFKQVSFIKYYITKTQITQFFLIMIQNGFCIYRTWSGSGFGYPISICYFYLFYMLTMVMLFANFLFKDQMRQKVKKQ